MVRIDWPSLNGIEAGKLSAARRLAHNAVHWLVRFTNSYGERVEGTPQLVWNPRDAVIETIPFLDDYSVELRVRPLEMQFREGGKLVPHTLDFDERTPAHIEAWVLVELLHRGIDRNRYSKALPYAPSDLMSGDHEDFEPSIYERELTVIDQSFRAGAAVIEALRDRQDGSQGSGVPLSCWPELFQIGFEIALPQGSGANSLRVGIAPGDGVRPEPYFFVGSEQQAQTASFTRDCVLSMRDAASGGLDAESVVKQLEDTIASQRRKLAG